MAWADRIPHGVAPRQMPSLLPNANDTILATYQASIVTSVALPFLVYFALGALLFFLFCILRTRIPSLSEPKRKLLIDPPPALSPSFVNWLFELMRIPNHAVAKTAGTEALIVLRFMRSSFFFFLILSLLSITVILPINYSGGEVDRLASQPILSYNETSNTTIQVFVNQTNSSWSIFGVDELTALRRISIENVGKDSWQSIAHLVLAVVIQLLALVNVRAFMAESIGTRVQKVRRDLATCTGKDCGCLAAAGSNSITPCAQSPTGNGNASSATLDAPNSPGKPAHIDPDSPSAVSLNNTSLPRPPSPKPHTPVAPIDLRSILLLNLPRPLRHPFALRQYFERTLKFGAEVESVVLVAANAELEEALEKRWEALRDVEEGWIAWVGNSGESRGGSVESVRKRVDGMRKELENEGIALTRVVAAGPGMENGEGTAIELPGLPLPSSNLLELGSTTSLVELGPNPLTRPRRTAGLWTRIKSKLWPGSVPPHALQESDALSEAWARFRYFHRRVGVLRKQAGKDAQVAFAGGDVGNDDGGSTAFVTFKTARSAVIACQTLLPPSPGQGRGSFLILPAPPPRDLYWPNLSSRFSTPKVAFLRTLFALGCLVALVFFWAVPVGMIATFLSVENLTARFPGFAKMAAELSPQFLDAFRAFVPSILVGIWMAILPAIVLLLCYIQGIETYSWIELSAFSKLFFYYVWNLVLVFPISGGVWNAIEVVGKAGEIPYLMGGALPGVAPFFINYINLVNFVFTPLLVLLPGPLLGPTILRIFARFAKSTPRRVAALAFPTDWFTLNLGLLLPTPMLVFTLAIMYSQIQPLVCLAGCLYFLGSFVAIKYLVLYQHVPLAESRGTGYGTRGFGGAIVHRIVFSVILHALTMWGVLVYKGHLDAGTVLGVLEIGGAVAVYLLMDWTWGKWERFVGLGAAVENEVGGEEEGLLEDKGIVEGGGGLADGEASEEGTKGAPVPRRLTVRSATTGSIATRRMARRSRTVAGSGSFLSLATTAEADETDEQEQLARASAGLGSRGNFFLEPGYVAPADFDGDEGGDHHSISGASQRSTRGLFAAAAMIASSMLSGGATDGRIPESSLETSVPPPDVKTKEDVEFTRAKTRRMSVSSRRASVSAMGGGWVGIDEPDHEGVLVDSKAEATGVKGPAIKFDEPVRSTKQQGGASAITLDFGAEQRLDKAKDDAVLGVGDPFVNGLEFLPSTSYAFDTFDPSRKDKHWRRYTNYLEPPATRVPGILNPLVSPLRGQSLFASRVAIADDASLQSYEHPAVVGRLPWIWLPDVEDVLRVDAEEGDLTEPAITATSTTTANGHSLETANPEPLVRSVSLEDKDDELIKRVRSNVEAARQAELERQRKLAERPWWLWGSTAEPPERWMRLMEDVDHGLNAFAFWGSWIAR